MRAIALLVALTLTQGCIAVGAISGGVIGTLAPIGIAANSSDPEARAAPATIIISGLVCAGIGALIGILATEDRKQPKVEHVDDESETTSAE